MITMRSITRATLLLAIAALTAQAQVGASVTAKDANSLPEAEIAALPGMTPALAKALVAARPFSGPAAFDAFLKGTLTDAQRTELSPRLWVHLNLNAATREEIALVPGMGPRMIREFLEYRPYKDLAVFRREMGKYVKPEEVARLEQYVFVPMNPTTASDADLMTIPGMGPRMVREFKEYRPWTSRAQFDKEIGKYVNAKEVARLAGFLTFPK
jgi:DNA uptake protein ComE-like DNA-binding protein